MTISVHDAVARLDGLGLVERNKRDHSGRVIEQVSALLRCVLPRSLEQLYRENIHAIGEFLSVIPIWNDHVGWRTEDELITRLSPAEAAPLFWDGCGSLYGLDLTAGFGTPAVYFFDHCDGFAKPHWAAGSSLATFLLILGSNDRARDKKWPERWELQIDPEIENCPRAPAIWNAG
jgi:hypothetical protein